MKFKEKKMNRETFVSIWPDVKTIFLKQNSVILCNTPLLNAAAVCPENFFFLKGSFRINKKV